MPEEKDLQKEKLKPEKVILEVILSISQELLQERDEEWRNYIQEFFSKNNVWTEELVFQGIEDKLLEGPDK